MPDNRCGLSQQANPELLVKKLALGTAQFGLDYGISNKTGRIDEEKVRAILDFARQENIEILDTAYAYGTSEEVLGRYFESSKNCFKIITKLNFSLNERYYIEQSFSRLRQKKVYGFLIHNFKLFRENPAILETLLEYKSQGRIDKVGFSINTTEELEHLLEKGVDFDIVQLPYSVFDRRFEPYFKSLCAAGMEIHVRSVYLQGLFFKKTEELPPCFDSVREKLGRLHRICEELGVSVCSLCINFALPNGSIDKVVIGIERIENLEEAIEAAGDMNKVWAKSALLDELRVDDENILLPFRWKLN